MLLTNHDTAKIKPERIPEDIQVIHKGPEFAVDLANLLMQIGMIG